MTAQSAAAPTAKHSAPNTAGAKASAPDKKAWSAEIHTPAGEYNANVPVADIVPDPQNRKPEDEVDTEADAQLADSIEADGLVQPVALRPCPRHPGALAVRHVVDKVEYFRVFQGAVTTMENLLYQATDKRDADRVAAIYRSGQGWQLIAGERRWRAHVHKRIKTIRGFIHRGETDASALIKQTVENSTRLDLHPIQEARQMKRLSDEGVPQKEIGKRFGNKSQPVVSQMLKLLEFPPEVQQYFATGELSPAHGEGLAKYLAWPKALAVIAKKVYEYDWDAKRLRDRDLPCSDELKNKGLAQLIYVGDSDYEARPKYRMPAELAKQPGFFKSGYNEWAYLKPEDPKAPNLWEPERDKQDKARAATEKKSAGKEAASQSKMTPAEKRARQEKIAENKQARAETALAGVRVIERIKGLKDFDGASIVVLAATAIGAHWKYGRNERVKDLATKLGISLPKGFDSDDTESMAKLKPVDAMRLAAAALVDADCEEGIKYSNPICDRVEHVLGPKVTAELRKKASDELAAAAAKKAGKKS